MDNTSEHLFNYSAFEAFFRGPRKEIKERLSIYLPLITLLPPLGILPALDIGCGRGEWLELLKDNHINGTGIDSNAEFIECCRELDLKAEEVDLFHFLSRAGDQKYNLITGFHLIEHIAPEKQLWFLDSMFRLLMPGGMVILETPNPENVTVGSCNFYIDPTHLRPVPPHLLHVLALQAGFASPLIARVNRNTVGEPLRMMAGETPEAALYNRLVDIISSRLLQAPDYALIAFKPPAPTLAMLDAVSAINQLNDLFLLPPAVSEIPDNIAIEKMERTEPSLNTIDIPAATNVRSNRFSEYPESVLRTYLQLLASR